MFGFVTAGVTMHLVSSSSSLFSGILSALENHSSKPRMLRHDDEVSSQVADSDEGSNTVNTNSLSPHYTKSSHYLPILKMNVTMSAD